MKINRLKLLRQAEKRVTEFDRIDAESAGTPQQMGHSGVLNTIRVALDASLANFERGDQKTGFECIADSVVMACRALGVKVR